MASEASAKKWIDVSAGLVFRNGLLLITQRRAQDHLGGLWEFPGGKREPGESFEACLHRELREELAIEIRIRELVDTIEHKYPEKAVRLKFFQCDWRANEPQAMGCHAIAWVTAQQLKEYEFPAADARLINKLLTTSHYWS